METPIMETQTLKIDHPALSTEGRRMDGWKVEKIAGGQFIVRAAADSRRLGFVVGGGRRWAAEVGPATIGYFSSRAAACRAIVAHASGRP